MTSPTTDRRFGLVGNAAMKAPVTALAAGNITQSGQQTIDGVAVLAVNAAGVPDRVLCVGQTDSRQNGIWDVSTAAWSRSIDADGKFDLQQGSTVQVNKGSSHAGEYWRVTSADPITIGSTALTWDHALAGQGSSITFLQAGVGAVQRDAQSKMREVVSAFDFMTSAQVADVIAGTLTQDVTAAVQTFVNAISSNTAYGAPKGFIPPGRYKLTSSINFPSTYCDMSGAGMFQSRFACDGVTGSVFKVAAIQYFSPHWRDFSIVDGTLTTTGIGIDTTAMTPAGTAQMFNFEFKNLYIYTKGDALVSYAAFSGRFDGIVGNSSASHGFRVACGPAVVWTGCYAQNVGAGKAGYRLTGLLNLYGCNGIDSGDYWGVFGQDPAAADGFQNDFPGLGSGYPDINLHGCNVEQFGVNGITVHNSHSNFRMVGGKLDRANLNTAYHSIIAVLKSPLGGISPVLLAPGAVFQGTGVPNGGAALTQAWLYVAGGAQAVFVDENGVLANSGITKFHAVVYGSTIPIATRSAVNDIYGGTASKFNAVMTARLSLGMTCYNTPAALTPVGSAQAISVTGYSKVTVTPAAAASITTATFEQTPGAGTDYQRNGDLLIEAGNGNLTVNHSASGNSTFRMAGAANVAMAAGQILRFCWSSTSNQWIQV